MSDHREDAGLGAGSAHLMYKLFFADPNNAEVCPLCFSAGASLYLLSHALRETEVDEEELISYLEDFAKSVYLAIDRLKKEAGHRDPPKFPDKRTLN